MKNYKQTDLFQEEEALTLSAEDTRVSRFPLPDVKKAKKIRDTSGRNILDSLENYVQVTSLERTWADIFDSVWIPYSKIWTARTTPSGALVLKQRVSVPRTGVKESSGSLWLTPSATNIDSRSEKALEYRKAYRESIGRKTVPPGNLSEQVQYGEPTTDMKLMFPTPSSRDWKGGHGTIVEEDGKYYRVSNTTGTRYGARLDAQVEKMEEQQMMFPTPRASDVEGGIVEDVELNNGSFSRRNKKGERWGVKLRDAANYLDKKEKEEPSFFPTPQAADHLANQSETLEAWEKRAEKKKEEGINLQFALRHAVQMWPTPQAMDGMRSGQIRKREELSEAAKKGGCSNLREAVHDPKYLEQNMLPTPTARDWKGPRKPETLKKNGRLPSNSLPDKVRSEVKKSEEKLHLNPTWVEGMMGFPHGWTDLGNEESPE
jgi:hypothetical protein